MRPASVAVLTSGWLTRVSTCTATFTDRLAAVLAGQQRGAGRNGAARGGDQGFAAVASVGTSDVGDVSGAHSAARLHPDIGQLQIVQLCVVFADGGVE